MKLNMLDNTSHGINRRSLVRLMGASGAVGLAGCIGGGEESDGPDGESDVLVEGLDSDPDNLDIHELTRVPEVMVAASLHDSLFVYDFDLELQPHLATEYEVNDDATEFTFTLRDDVTFHDGTEFDAEIAVWNMERHLDLSPVAWELGPVDTVQETGESEMTFFMEDSHPFLINYLPGPQKGFTTPNAIDEYGEQYGAEGVVGTGPLQLDEWRRDDEIRLSRFDEYDWAPDYLDHEGSANFEEYRVRIIPEETTLLNEVTVGDVDGTPFIAPDDVSDVEEHENTQIERVEDAHPHFLHMNIEREPLDELEVRRAIMYAVDRDGIINAAHGGEAYPIWSLNPPMAVGAMDEEVARDHAPNFDRDRARELLDEAGWTNSEEGETRTRDGETLELNFFAFTMPLFARTGEVVQSMLQSVGIETQLEILESGTFYDRADGGEAHLFTFALGSSYQAVDTLTTALHSRNHPEDGGFAYSFVRDDTIDELIDGASVETDEQRQKEMLVEAQKRALDQAYLVPLVGQNKFYAHRNDINGGDWFDHPWWPSSDKNYINRFEVNRQ